MIALIVIILVILIVSVCRCRGKAQERFVEPLQGLGFGSVGQDGILTGFEQSTKNQLDMLKNAFTDKIRPTLLHFLSVYDRDGDIQADYRLKREGEILGQEERERVKGFLERVADFQTKNLFENANPPADETSYTNGKEYIYMCLRNRAGRNHSDDILIFAFIHELAHVGCDEQGHTDAFWAYFRLLIQILCRYEVPGVSHVGIKYCYRDLRVDPYHGYCQNNFHVRYNPLFDREAFIQ